MGEGRGGSFSLPRRIVGRVGDRFAGQSCVLCTEPSRGVGEHVWPRWFIGEFPREECYSIEKNGVPYTKRDGREPVTYTALQGVHVPMCEGCNSQLDRTIEKPAMGLVQQLVRSEPHAWPSVPAEDVGTLVRWLLKVGLLTLHPEAQHDSPHVDRDLAFQRSRTVKSEWLEWMRAGTPPPDGFSVYAMRRSDRVEQPWRGEKRWIFLPRVVVASKDWHYRTWEFGIPDLDITIVWHPGWPVLHPLVEEGRAATLWPTPSDVDFAALPELHRDEFRFCTGGPTTPFTDTEQLRRAAQTPLQVGQLPLGSSCGGTTPPAER